MKHVVTDVDRHGNMRRYVRIKGCPKVRLHLAAGADGFNAEYEAAVVRARSAPRTERRRHFVHAYPANTHRK